MKLLDALILWPYIPYLGPSTHVYSVRTYILTLVMIINSQSLKLPWCGLQRALRYIVLLLEGRYTNILGSDIPARINGNAH